MKKYLISFLIFITVFFLYLSDLKMYGGTWDELIFHIDTGRRYVDFLKTGNLKPILDYENSGWFPPVAPTIGELFGQNKIIEKYFPDHTDRFHIAAVLFGAMTIAIVFLIVERITGSLFVSIFSAILLFSYPQFVTHAHNNVRDIGLTFFYTLTIFVFMMASSKKMNLYWMVISGIAVGATTATKQNGAFLLFTGLIWFFLNSKAKNISQIGQFALGIFLFFSSFLVYFIFLWPYFWKDAPKHLGSAWNFLTDPKIIAGTVTFFDITYTSMKDLPRVYPFAMYGILTPPIVTLLFLAGILFLILYRRQGGVRNKYNLLVLLWFFFPFTRFIFTKSSIAYDQIRHFFETVPAFIVISSLGIYFLAKKSEKTKYLKAAVISIGVLALSYNLFISYRYRPYGTAYFNFFAGGGSYVSHAFDVEYFGNVYREAALYLNKTYGNRPIYYVGGIGIHILADNNLQGKMTDDLEDEFHYVIFMNKQNWVRNNPYLVWLLGHKKPIYTIERDGKILFYQFLPYKEEYLRQTTEG